MKLRLKRIAISVLMGAIGSLILGGGAAQASLELYAETDYRAWIGTFDTTNGTYWNMSSNANDTLSSHKNNTPYSVAFWYDINRGGHCFAAVPGQLDPDFWWFDDNKVSSFQIGRAC